MRVGDLSTPAAVVSRELLDANVAAMGTRWPGRSLRTHVKAFKSTALAARIARAGHPTFCAATVRELVGLARAGLGEDLLLANECVDPARLGELAAIADVGRVTVAVDSAESITAAADAGLREVLVDVNVGMPRCGCAPADAGRLARRARAAGLEVRGVMGYEGHLVGLEDLSARTEGVAVAMAALRDAHAEVGGDVVSGGGTGTWAVNTWLTELQAGSFALMDTAYATEADLPFVPALAIVGTVVSVNRGDGFAVADVGLKALGMDHGNPRIDGGVVWFCSDEHVTYSPSGAAPLPAVGDRVPVWPAHVDPTVAMHDRLHVVERFAGREVPTDAEVVDVWAVDLRGW